MKIIFERRPGVYLPEISAYRNYCARTLAGVETFESDDGDPPELMAYDVVWRFMGLDLRGTGQRVIHEYNSLSTGHFARLKNRLKRGLNARPHARIFLNEDVQAEFHFTDGIPARCRDMGVDRVFFQNFETTKEYDFVYAGSLNRGAIVRRVLERFRDHVQDRSVLIVGAVPDDIHKAFGNTSNLVFTGRVPYAEVPAMLSRARYGLNLMPDCYPLSLQTATKVLEYCAAGLPVVTTDYRWIRRFAQVRRAEFFYLKPDLSNLTSREIEAHAFSVPQVEDLEWDRVISRSGVFDFL